MPLVRQLLPRFASLSILPLLGALAGCGDDAPSRDSGTGGKDGGSDGSDASDGGGDGAPACYQVAFAAPTNMEKLSADDDKDGDRCANGFQLDVRITTSAPDGTDVNLFDGNTLLGTTQASGGEAVFETVQIASSGDSMLAIRFPSTASCTDPSTMIRVNVNCNVPTCTISKPNITATHPLLNGIPVAQGGDRASAAGSPYQVAFEVTTNAPDGQTVKLLIDNVLTPTVVTTVQAMASGGKASFSGVPLVPDGTYEIEATCPAANGVVGHSMKGTYQVDTVPPVLTVTKPIDDQFFGPGDLMSGKFQVCGRTNSTDSVGLPASLGATATNFCVAVGGSPNCVAVTAVATDACVDVTCPGGAPFDVAATLNDKAGNKTTSTVHGIKCASSLPSVQIISPISDAPTFGDTSKRLLAAGAGQVLRDLQAGTPGAQTDVSACSNRAGSATLFVGLAGGTLAQVGNAVNTTAAVAADGCPAGFGFIARFVGVTLPESTEGADGSLTAATQLRVDLTDASTAVGTSPLVDIWVDSVVPVVSLRAPVGLCGSFNQAPTTYMTPIELDTDTADITLTISNGSSTGTFTNPTFAGGVATFSSVVFNQGQSNVAATAADRAGNTTAMQPIPCTVTVGMGPVVVFTSPSAGQQLCAAGSVASGCVNDASAGSAGWQGSLVVSVTVDGAPLTSGTVTFSAGGSPLGMATLDGSGNATIPGITLFDGIVTITAQTSNVPGHGVGTGTVTVVVDTGPPDVVTNLSAAVLDRRQTSFQLSWTAPADNGQRVAGYEVRYAKVPITTGNFDDTSVTGSVAYTGMPAAPGQPDGIAVPRLNIEQDYYFAVVATDSTGSRSPIAATAAAVRAQFLTTVLAGINATDGIGVDIDGTADIGRASDRAFTPDGFSDLIVGGSGGKNVYIFFGSMAGYSTTPSITITGTTNNFGQAVVNAGDLDGDGLPDIAVASPAEGGGKVYIYSRKNPPASWGSTTNWPAALTDAQATYTLTADLTFAGGLINSIPTRGMSRLGNFDGTGTDDLAIGFGLHAARLGAVLVVKGSSSFGSLAIPDASGLTIEIDGTIPIGVLGFAVVGIGQFYPSPAGPALMTSAPLGSAVYAYRGQGAGPLSTTNADDSVIGTAAERYGINLGFLGPLGVSPGAVTIGSTTGRYLDVHLGTASTGPFLGTMGGAPSASVRFTDSQSGNSFSVVNLGGGIKGTSSSVSFIGGDSVPDLVLGGQAETNLPLYIVNGAALSTLSGTVDVSTVQPAVIPSIVKVSGKMPSAPTAWGGYAGAGLIVDSNNDGYADFAVGEAAFGKPGRVVVLY